MTQKATEPLMLYFGDRWDHLWRRRQQLAWRLAGSGRFGRVLYVERPLPATSLLKFLMGWADRDGRDRWRRTFANRSWMMPVDEKLAVLTTFAPLPPLGLATLFATSERLRDYWLLRWLDHHFDHDRPLICISHPQLSVEVIRVLKPSLLWYDCTEDFAAVPGIPACVRAQVQETDRWLTEHADVVTAVSRTLYDEKRQVNPNTYWLPNAVDTDLFLKSPDSLPLPEELRGVAHPVLAFVGGLNDWAHDWALLDQAATLRPEWSFLLIGDLSVAPKTRLMLRGHPNVLCVGQKPYHHLPAYLVHSDVCFQFYRPERGNDTRNSQKVFLYLAAGKPIVSTPSADAENYRDLVRTCRTPEEMVQQVEELLRNDGNLLRQKRLAVAAEGSWDRRAQCILDLLSVRSAPSCSRVEAVVAPEAGPIQR